MSEDKDALIRQLERAYELQKKAREEADQLLEEKSRELYIKNESLKEALEKLSQQHAQLITQEKLASVGQLGASLAHELNNPNAFIQNNLVTLEDYVKQLTKGLHDSLSLLENVTKQIPGADEQHKIVESCKSIRDQSELDFIESDMPSLLEESLNGTKRITSIANSLRYFANPDVSTRKALDVNECITQAQTLVHNKDQLADVCYELADIPPTLGLPMLLSQALANIIQNAVEAQRDRPKVTIRSYEKNDNIIIEVEDNGDGIEAEQAAEVFKPFYSTKSGQNGLGLGIAKHIVEQHEGQIEMNSVPGSGCCVRITIPLVPFSN